jgi:hypothetical protein
MSHKIHYQAHYNKDENMPLSQSSNVDNGGAITIDAGDPVSTSPTPAATVTPPSKSYAAEINNLGVCVMLSISPLGIPSFSLTSSSSGSDDDSTIDIQVLENDSDNDEEESWSQVSDASSSCNEHDTLSLAYSDSCIADDKSLPDVTRQDSHRPVMNLPQKLFFTSPQDWSDSDDDDDSLSDCGTSVDANGTPDDEDTPMLGMIIICRSRAFPSHQPLEHWGELYYSCREIESDGEKTKLESDRTEGELC